MKLQTRILTGFSIVVALFIGLGVTVVASQRSQLTSQLDARLESVVPLRPGPGPSGGGERQQGGPPPADAVQEPISDLYIGVANGGAGIDVQVLGQLLESTPDPSALLASSPRSFINVDSVDGSTTFRVLVDAAGGEGETIFIAVPSTDIDETMDRLTLVFVLATMLLAAVLGLIAWWIVRLGLRPISAITETARSITAGDKAERAPSLDERTEAGQLAGAFNVMLDQREAAENKLRQFVSDASHELRTPLTSIRGYLDLYVDGGFREPGQLDDVVRRMQSEAGRMSSLVESLLQLARLDEEQPLVVTTVAIDELVNDVVAGAIAAHPGRSVEAVLPKHVEPVEIDRLKISQLVAALVDNALVHAPDASVVVEVQVDAGELQVAVVDDGLGLSIEEVDRVFDRFYRSDASRVRTTGGSGLGLGIAKAIAEAHEGELSVQSSPGNGCRFILRVPRRG